MVIVALQRGVATKLTCQNMREIVGHLQVHRRYLTPWQAWCSGAHINFPIPENTRQVECIPSWVETLCFIQRQLVSRFDIEPERPPNSNALLCNRCDMYVTSSSMRSGARVHRVREGIAEGSTGTGTPLTKSEVDVRNICTVVTFDHPGLAVQHG